MAWGSVAAGTTSAAMAELGTVTTGAIVDWQVVEVAGNASVQSGSASLSTVPTVISAGLTAPVPLDSSCLLFSYDLTLALSQIGTNAIRGRMTATDQVTFDRGLAGNDATISWYVLTWDRMLCRCQRCSVNETEEGCATVIEYEMGTDTFMTQTSSCLINGNSPAELVSRFGSPLHVIDEQALHQNVAAFSRPFEAAYAPVEIYYSYKTNPVPAAIRILHELGVGAEVVSPFEYWLAGALGMRGERIVVNGPGKTPAYVETVAAGGCRVFNIDHHDEIELLERAKKRATEQIAVGIRVAAPSGWKVQFGIEPKEVLNVAEAIAHSEVAYLAGLHVHLGTSIQHPKVYERAISLVADLCREIGKRYQPLRFIDLGGGFPNSAVAPMGLRERAALCVVGRLPPPQLRRRMKSLEEHVRVIGIAMRAVVRASGGEPPTLVVEPGRALTGTAQTLLLRVHATKLRSDGTRYAITDAGPHGVAGPMRFETHRIKLVSRNAGESTYPYTIVGPTCSPPDTLGCGVQLPMLRVGDTLAVENSGAYFTAMESTFGFSRSAIVMVDCAGAPRLVRDRETHEDLVRRDITGPGSPRPR